MKQKNKIQLLLVAAFAGLGVMCYAQQAKMCKDTPGGYNIVSLQDPSDPSSYEWWEDGVKIQNNATAAVYTVPSDKAVGKYTYIRRSKKEGCDWASSNAYTVEVLICDEDPKDIGNKGVVKDTRDGKVYKTVKMPDGKVWMAENLNYQSGLTFNQQAGQANGQPYTSNTNGVPAIGSFWCPAVAGATLSADKNTCNVYGALYTWETAMSADGGKDDKGGKLWNESTVSSHYHDISSTPATSQNDQMVHGICPAGYHLPSDYEWAALIDAINPNSSSKCLVVVGTNFCGSAGAAGSDAEGAGVLMKSSSTYMGFDEGNGSWSDHNNRGNDATGFGILPAGTRHYGGTQYAGRGTLAAIWTATSVDPLTSWCSSFGNTESRISRWAINRHRGLSVRCLKD
jgi:uncharacterized protein (TIGR02145 family)